MQWDLLDIHFVDIYLANCVHWSWLSSAIRRIACENDCVRRKGVWKCKVHLLWAPSTIQCLNDLDASTSWSPLWSMSFLHDDRLLSYYGYAEALSSEKFYRGMYSFLYSEWFQLNWRSFITAINSCGRFAAEWYIQIGIWYQKQTFWLKHLNLSWIFFTVITTRDDLVLYWEDCVLSASTTSLLVKIEVFDLFWFCTTWCPSSSMRVESGHCIGRGIWPLLISSIVMPIFIYWAESGHCFTIGTFGFHRVHL